MHKAYIYTNIYLKYVACLPEFPNKETSIPIWVTISTFSYFDDIKLVICLLIYKVLHIKMHPLAGKLYQIPVSWDF